jgi:hypothetical protein
MKIVGKGRLNFGVVKPPDNISSVRIVFYIIIR